MTGSTTQQSSARGRRKRSWLRSAWVITAAITTITLVSVLAFFVLAKPRLPRPALAQPFALCETTPCRYYGRYLAQSINESQDPCVNFYRYVCDGRNGRPKESVLDMHQEVFIRDVAETLESEASPPLHQSAFQKAATFYRSCISVVQDDVDEMEQFRDILDGLGIHWPHHSNNTDLLGTMLRTQKILRHDTLLNIRWSHVNGTSGVRIWSSDSVFTIMTTRSEVRSKREHREFFTEMYRTFWNSTLPSAENYAYDSMSTAEDAVEEYLKPPLLTTAQTIVVDLVVLADLTPGLTYEMWSSALSSEVILSPNQSVPVSVNDVAYLRAFDRLLQKIGKVALHEYISWFTVQTLAPFMSYKLARYVSGSSNDAIRNNAPKCFWLVDKCLGWLAYSQYAVSQLNIIVRRNISDILREVLHTLEHRVRTSQRLGLNETQVMKIGQTGVTFEHVKFLADPILLELIYSELPNMGSSVTANWLSAVRATRNVSAKEESLLETSFARTYKRRVGHNIVSSLWDQPSHSIHVSPIAASLPVYDYELPKAVNFGALGSFGSAAAIEHLIEVLSESNYTWKDLASSGSCQLSSHADTAARRSELARLLSLDIAFESFQNAKRNESDVRLSGHDKFPEEKVFFQAACFLHCGSNANAAETNCNNPVRQSKSFASVYSCLSSQNAEDKNCDLF